MFSDFADAGSLTFHIHPVGKKSEDGGLAYSHESRREHLKPHYVLSAHIVTSALAGIRIER
jgi:hypothetical protein